ncbi:MAG: heavy-metal-associated domain-containing protein [Rhodoglobus sp.]
MNTGTRLAIYGLGLVVAFGGAFGIAGAVVPDSVIARWNEESEMNDQEMGEGAEHDSSADTKVDSVKGQTLGLDGYVLSTIEAPEAAGEPGELSFQIKDDGGAPLTEYARTHDRDLHLIVVRSDGSQFRHVHPTLDDSTGAWSIPWEWAEAGSYRVYADFTPAGDDASGLTLTRTVHVEGEFTPRETQQSRVDHVDGFTISLDGEMEAGATSDLTITVMRDGDPVTTLEPYLGAFGHLVALREGDLAYLHVHAGGADPKIGDTSGPEIAFAAKTPTSGRYLLYLDFQVDGQVYTAEFVLDAARGDGVKGAESGSHSDEGH